MYLSICRSLTGAAGKGKKRKNKKKKKKNKKKNKKIKITPVGDSGADPRA